MITEKVNQFNEIIQAKGIDLQCDLEHKKVNVSMYLMDILLNNLFSNSIRHNVHHGKIAIILDDKKLIFENTGKGAALDNHKLFEALEKSQNAEGKEFGLTIAHNICSSSHFILKYQFDAPFHQFIVEFPNKKPVKD